MRPRVEYARCEGCHRAVRVSGAESKRANANPNLWYCPECRGEPAVYRDQREAEEWS